MNGHGDLNNAHAARKQVELAVDPSYGYKSLAIRENDDDLAVRHKYRPFLLPDSLATDDWVAQLELSTVVKMMETEIQARANNRLRILVLYGSLRAR